jgi:hypothetical protein
MNVRVLHGHCIAAEVTVPLKTVLIPRIHLCPSDPAIPFKPCRGLFPIKIGFFMTISKFQGQKFNLLKYIYHRLFFPHGQLYVVFSRLFSFDNVTVSLTEGHCQRIEKERLLRSNTVFQDVLNSGRNDSFLLTQYCTLRPSICNAVCR